MTSARELPCRSKSTSPPTLADRHPQNPALFGCEGGCSRGVPKTAADYQDDAALQGYSLRHGRRVLNDLKMDEALNQPDAFRLTG
jgi:hypothetical protein